VVPAPVRPTSAEPIDGSGRLVRSTEGTPQRASAGVDVRSVVPPAEPTTTLRVDGSQPVERGVFETFLGALIGFLFS
jgi:hypothetical protein